MNDKEIHESEKTDRGITSTEKSWSFCPACGNKLPEVLNLKFCIKCGMNLQYLKEHKQMQPRRTSNPYVKQSIAPPSYIHPIKYGPKKLSDEETLNTKDIKLWGTWPSIGIPLGAFILMDLVTTGIFFVIMFFTFDLEAAFILDPYFLIFSSFFELIFILVPTLYIAKYLQNPTLKNRLGLLGFTRKGFDRVGLIKEILIGLGFSIVGILLVGGVTFITEILLESLFNIQFIETSTDIDLIISSADILSIILLAIVMILIIGTSEEILFRGFMQKGLTRNLGKWGGILLTALIFALIHVMGIVFIYLDRPLVLLISFLYWFIPYFAISLFLGLIYQWRNENLISNIICHGVYNAITILLAFFFYNLF